MRKGIDDPVGMASAVGFRAQAGPGPHLLNAELVASVSPVLATQVTAGCLGTTDCYWGCSVLVLSAIFKIVLN